MSQPRKKEEAPRSFFEQLGDLVVGLGKGAVALPVELGKSMAEPFKLGYDYVAGNDVSSSLAGQLNDAGGPILAATPGVHLGNRMQKQLGESTLRTAGNIAHPSRYLQASREGRILDAIVEDVTNLSMLGKGLGVAAGGAKAAAAGAGMARTAALADAAGAVADVMHAPVRSTIKGIGTVTGSQALLDASQMSPVRAIGKGIGSVADAGWQKVVKGDLPRGIGQDAALAIQNKFPRLLTEQGRAVSKGLGDMTRAGERAKRNTYSELYRASEAGGNNVINEGAALAHLNGVGATDKLFSDIGASVGLTPEQIRATHALDLLPEQGYTPELQAAYHDYANGNATPEQIAAIEQQATLQRAAVEKSQTERMTGRGRLKGGLDPAQLSNDVLDDAMMTELEKAGMAPVDLATVEQLRQQGYTWDEISQWSTEVANQLDNYMVYPSRWRPAMRAARMAGQAIEEAAAAQGKPRPQLPFRPEELLAAGVPDPLYLPGGKSRIFEKPGWRSGGGEPLNTGTEGMQGATNEQVRVSADLQPYSNRTLAEQLASANRTMARNAGLLDVMRDNTATARSHFSDPEWKAMEAKARAEVLAQHPNDVANLQSPDPAVVAQARGKLVMRYRELFGNQLERGLKAKGQRGIAGDLANPTKGDFNPRSGIAAKDLNGGTLTLPDGLAHSMEQRFSAPGLHTLPLDVVRFFNAKFKSAVLPLSIRWQLGDVVGGAFMSWVGGGIPPNELIAGMRQLKGLSADAENAILHNQNFVDQGMFGQQAAWENPLGAVAKEPRTPFGKFKKKSFALNQTINHFNRGGYLLAKTERLLNELGLSIEKVDASAAWDQPNVQRAISRAVEDANRTMGSFDRLSPAERRYVTGAMPFYAWTRHITSLAFRTAIDSPARIMWTLRLGQMGEDNGWRPDWLKGSLDVPDALLPDFIFGEGDGAVPLQFLMPFNDVANNPAFTPAGLARSLSPGIKIPMAGLFGIEPAPNDQFNPLQKVTRPYGEQRGIGGMFTDALQSGISSFPLARAAQNVLPTGTVGGISFGYHPRYHSGRMMVDSQGRPIDSTSRAVIPLDVFGIPKATPMSDIQAMQAAALKRNKVKKKKQKRITFG